MDIDFIEFFPFFRPGAIQRPLQAGGTVAQEFLSGVGGKSPRELNRRAAYGNLLTFSFQRWLAWVNHTPPLLAGAAPTLSEKAMLIR